MPDDLREAAIDAAEKALGAEGFDVALESDRRIAEVALDAADAALTAMDAHRPSDPVREAAQALADAVLLRKDDLDAIENTRGLSGSGLHVMSHINDFVPLAAALRAALADGVAAGPQATPGQVLWEGETSTCCQRTPPMDDHSSLLHTLHGWLPVPPGTRVRVVAAPTGPEETDDG